MYHLLARKAAATALKESHGSGFSVKHVGSCENDKKTINFLKSRGSGVIFNDVKNLKELLAFDEVTKDNEAIPNHHFVYAGSPCDDFSRSNNKWLSHATDFQNKTGTGYTLFKQFAEFASSPSCPAIAMVCENVAS